MADPTGSQLGQQLLPLLKPSNLTQQNNRTKTNDERLFTPVQQETREEAVADKPH